MPLFASYPVAAAGSSAASDMTAMAHAMPNASFTLRTGIAQGKMVFIGKGGAIDGKVNPVLPVHEGDIVQVTIVNGEGAEHDIVVPELHVSSQRVAGPGASSTLMLHATDIGSFLYFCSIGGHREAGMEDQIKVEATAPKVADKGVASHATPPIFRRRLASAVRPRCATSLSRSNASAVLMTARPMTFGPSTARCRVRCCAFAWATPSCSV
jgi:plastocyanin